MLIRIFLLTIITAADTFAFSASFKRKNLTPLDPEYWHKRAIPKIHIKSQNFKQAQNIIFFVGKSMSVSTITAARIFLTQKEDLGAFESDLAFDKFPFSGFVKTHCLDQVTSDAACSATAFLGGVKANYGTVGVSGAVTRKNCKEMLKSENKVSSIARLFQLNGRRTGVVTTSSITDAPVSALYAHSAECNWQSDSNVRDDGENPKECVDIASQLIYSDTGRHLNVIFGGGRKYLLPNTEINDEGKGGSRTDGRNLINEWHRSKASSFHSYVSDRDGMYAINDNVDYALGVFTHDHMTHNVDRNISKEPSLREMTKKAIQLLSKNEEGYFLFVESGGINRAHRASKAQIALDEMLELDKAVKVAVDLTNSKNTLIVVTSDHSNTMTLSGNFNWKTLLTKLGEERDDEGFPHAIINYASGPGFKFHKHHRHNLSNDDFDVHYKYPALFPTVNSKHSPHDVGIFANGPWSNLFSGVIEQYVIPHKMACAAGLRIKIN